MSTTREYHISGESEVYYVEHGREILADREDADEVEKQLGLIYIDTFGSWTSEFESAPWFVEPDSYWARRYERWLDWYRADD